MEAKSATGHGINDGIRGIENEQDNKCKAAFTIC